ncbi:MAG TPA: hypothetical protein VMQ45_01850 [Burkholderiaceae bacterium]|nr:hypothetical protein [Burkholderiaceae bacterium]
MICQTHLRIVLGCITAGLMSLAGDAALATDESKNETKEPTPPYELGSGMRLGNSGFYLGGYGSAEYSAAKGAKPDVALSNADLFFWWENQSGLKFFSEFDAEYEAATHRNPSLGERRALSLPRLYLDDTFSDSLTVRLGKFLTPIGRWNLIHADPLVWTTSRPLPTKNPFPETTTGAMALGNFSVLGRSIDYSVYGSANGDFHRDPDENTFHKAIGLHFNAPVNDTTQLGFSYVSFSQRPDIQDHQQLLGLDLLWAHHGFEIMSEAVRRASSAGSRGDESGAYLQGVVPVYGRLYGVVRVEGYHRPLPQQTIRDGVVGLTYRQSRAISYKIEVDRSLYSTGNDSFGFLSSVSVLF